VAVVALPQCIGPLGSRLPWQDKGSGHVLIPGQNSEQQVPSVPWQWRTSPNAASSFRSTLRPAVLVHQSAVAHACHGQVVARLSEKGEKCNVARFSFIW
jgi:hypothetical protein